MPSRVEKPKNSKVAGRKTIKTTETTKTIETIKTTKIGNKTIKRSTSKSRTVARTTARSPGQKKAPPPVKHLQSKIVPASTPRRQQRQAKKKCPLLNLPRELRDRIWEWALIEDEPINISNRFKETHIRLAGTPKPIRGPDYIPEVWELPPTSCLKTGSAFGLLGTNKQIREETATMAYGANIFVADNPSAMLQFVLSVGDSNEFLRQLDIKKAEILNKTDPDEDESREDIIKRCQLGRLMGEIEKLKLRKVWLGDFVAVDDPSLGNKSWGLKSW